MSREWQVGQMKKLMLAVVVCSSMLAMTGQAVAQTTVDFEEFAFTPVCGAPPAFVSQGVAFSSTPNGCLTIYECPECGVYPPGNKTLAINTVGGGEAVLSATFPSPVLSVSAQVSDTERSVTVQAFSQANVLVFEATFTPTDPVTRLLAVSSPEGIARIEMRDEGGDGLVLDNVVFPIAPCGLVNDLLARIGAAGLAPGVRNSLEAKLLNAQRRLCDGDPANDAQASGVLGAFQNELAAQSGKKIDAALAASLADQAQVIIDTLGGF